MAAFLPALALVCRDALANYFGPDDLMNLYVAWTTPIQNTAKDLLLFWQAQSRPLGTVFHRLVYEAAGFRPEVFAAARLILLALNLWLAWQVLLRLTESRNSAWLATLALGYHATLFYIYASTGMVYDILCASAVLAGFLFYLQGRGTLWIAAAAILAVGAKEQGVALGVILLAHRLFVSRKGPWTPVAAACAIAAAFAAGRLLLPGPLSGIEWYRPDFSPERFLANARVYTRLLSDNRLPPALFAAAAFWVVLVVVSWKSSRSALLGLVWFWASLAPLLPLPAREGYVLYLPLFGLAVVLASVLARWTPAMPVWEAGLWAAVLILFQTGEHRDVRQKGLAVPLAEQIRQVCTQAGQLVPHPKAGARFLLVNTPLAKADEWSSQFALALRYGRKDIRAQARWWDQTTPLRVQADEFDHVLLFDESRREYREVTTAARAGLPAQNLPSRAGMGDPAALMCIVSGLGNASSEGHRWGLETMEFRFAAPPGGATRFFLTGVVPELTVKQNGPLRVRVYLNGELLGEQKLPGNVVLRLVQDFPARLPAGAVAHIRLQSLNPLRTESDTISISVREAGIE